MLSIGIDGAELFSVFVATKPGSQPILALGG